jgi:hypothetical protein
MINPTISKHEVPELREVIMIIPFYLNVVIFGLVFGMKKKS